MTFSDKHCLRPTTPHQCLDARFNMTLLCQLLQKPGAVGLRCAALTWIAAALEKSTARFASREDVLASIAAVCTITWHEHGDVVLTSPATRIAFLRTLAEMARHQVPGFRELRDDVEAVLAGVEAAASGSA